MWRFGAVLVLAFGCGSHTPEHPDAPDDIDAAGFQTATHRPMPLVGMHSGTVYDHIKLVTITYSTYPDKANVEKLGDELVGSDWFKAVGAEYGVMAGTHEAKVAIATPPPATLDTAGIAKVITDLVTAGTVPVPPATGSQYLYMLYVPHTVTLGADLANTLGYHDVATAGGATFAYAAILDDGTGIDTTSSTAAHELIEAATDPLQPPNDGYYLDPALPDPFYLILGEVADLCDGEALIRSGDFAVQRSYSNAAAAAGKSPCIPFDPDDTWFDVSASPATMPTIAAGGSVTYTLTGWSTKPVPDWTIEAYDADYTDLYAMDQNPTFSKTTINNGETVTLTLTAPATATHGQLGGVYVLSGDNFRPWVVGFTVQ